MCRQLEPPVAIVQVLLGMLCCQVQGILGTGAWWPPLYLSTSLRCALSLPHHTALPLPQRGDLSEEQRKVLSVLERTFNCYITEDPVAVQLKEKLNEAEAKLAASRNTMKLGYTDPDTSETDRETVQAGCVQCQLQLVLRGCRHN